MDYHFPVLLKPVLDFFQPKIGDTYLDGTMGNGGHSLALAKLGAKIIGLDLNSTNLNIAKQRFLVEKLESSLETHQANFKNFPQYLPQNGVSGILLDLGLSMSQYKDQNLGFSFGDTALDMRLDPNLPLSATSILQNYSQDELEKLFSTIAQEPLAKEISFAIVKTRKSNPITSAQNLTELISKTYQDNHQRTALNPATKVFLALKIAVNQELENLQIFLDQTLLLNPGTKIAIITFHSTEDRLVKLFLKANGSKLNTSSPVSPEFSEIKRNKPSRSALLRAYQIK